MIAPTIEIWPDSELFPAGYFNNFDKKMNYYRFYPNFKQ